VNNREEADRIVEKEEDGGRSQVKMRITDRGHYYEANERGAGPFKLQDEQIPDFDMILAIKLGVEPKDILLARLREITRPTTFDEVAEVLESTVRRDKPTKLILFAAMLLTFTDEDQINIMMSGESSIGKSYDANQVASYFPSDVVLILGGSSPTALYHEGVWDKKRRLRLVDLKQKILILLDLPHYSLMQRLRPLLSHDKREILYKITDRSSKGALRTKNVLIVGYPTVVFCTAGLSLDDQETTRAFLLSPESSSDKLDETCRQILAEHGDREGFRMWVESHPKRRRLKARIAALQAADIDQVIIEGHEEIYNRFRSIHPRLAPRHQRDLPRLLALIKAHALLNFAHRERREQNTIVATVEDVDAGFNLYSTIAKANDLGLSPQILEIYESVIRPLTQREGMVSRQRILWAYNRHYGRRLSEDRLRREILPALDAAGCIVQEPDPGDRRRMLIGLPDHSNISSHEQILDESVYHSDPSNQKNRQPSESPGDGSTQGEHTPHEDKPPSRGET